MAFLIDTNIIAEFRKGERANWGVRRFFAVTPTDSLFLPVQVIGEIRAGIAKAAKNGKLDQAKRYASWLDALVAGYKEQIIDFDRECAQVWGTLLSHEKKDPHSIDKQIAAIALISDLTLVSRDQGEAFTQIPSLKVLNPFHDPPDNEPGGSPAIGPTQ